MISISKEAFLPTKFGKFKIKIYKDEDLDKEHAVIYTEKLSDEPLMRIHSECLTGDVFSSIKCDCQDQLHQAMQTIQKDNGLILYLRQEGRGIGLLNKINAYHFQDKGMDTVQSNEHIGFDADIRDYKIVEAILNDMKIHKLKLMTNNPKKLDAIQKMKDIKKVSMVPLITQTNEFNEDYINTKKESMGHLF